MLKMEITPVAFFSCMAVMLLVLGISSAIQLLVSIFLLIHMTEWMVSWHCVLSEGNTSWKFIGVLILLLNLMV